MDLAQVYIDLDSGTHAAIDGEDPRPLSLLEMTKEHRHLVFLGDPGSGKSTFLNHLVLCLARHALDPEGSWGVRLAGWSAADLTLIPILIVLRDFAVWLRNKKVARQRSLALWDFVAEQLRDNNLESAVTPIHRALSGGQALVALDGLDEVPERDRDLIREKVGAFRSRYADSRILVTCRRLTYDKDRQFERARRPQLEGFFVCLVANFDEEKVQQFVRAWYAELAQTGRMDPELAVVRTDALINDVQRRGLAELAGNPMLLTVMAVVHSEHGELPDIRAKLYDEAVKVLLDRWEAQRATEQDAQQGVGAVLRSANCGMPEFQSALWRLAFEAYRDQEGGKAPVHIEEGRLRAALAGIHPQKDWNWAGSLIETIKLRAGLLIEPSPGAYTFPHLSFQEFLAGAHLAAQSDFAERAAQLDPIDWREEILFAVGKFVHIERRPAQARFLVGELCPDRLVVEPSAWRRIWLAGDILLEMGVGRTTQPAKVNDLAAQVRNWLVQLIRTSPLTSAERAAAGSVLGRLGDPRFDEKLGLPAEDLLGFVEIPEGTFRMGSDKQHDSFAREDELPQHEVHLPHYFISRYPVTVQQFRNFAEATAYKPNNPACLRGPNNAPVVDVNWYDAMKYCEWLSAKLRDSAATPDILRSLLRESERDGKSWKVTLPSEAEWEKAARGGDGRIYPWGDKPDPDRANCDEAGIGERVSVGCFAQGSSPYLVEELSGGVWEWTRSLWGAEWDRASFHYPYDTHDGREDTLAGVEVRRVVRGGSFLDHSWLQRSAYRGLYQPDVSLMIMGFRVVVSFCY
jgi:formylglycine-generating enzyme required for sulfatase activity